MWYRISVPAQPNQGLSGPQLLVCEIGLYHLSAEPAVKLNEALEVMLAFRRSPPSQSGLGTPVPQDLRTTWSSLPDPSQRMGLEVGQGRST